MVMNINATKLLSVKGCTGTAMSGGNLEQKLFFSLKRRLFLKSFELLSCCLSAFVPLRRWALFRCFGRFCIFQLLLDHISCAFSLLCTPPTHNKAACCNKKQLTVCIGGKEGRLSFLDAEARGWMTQVGCCQLWVQFCWVPATAGLRLDVPSDTLSWGCKTKHERKCSICNWEQSLKKIFLCGTFFFHAFT